MNKNVLTTPTIKCSGYVTHAMSSIIRSNCRVDLTDSPKVSARTMNWLPKLAS